MPDQPPLSPVVPFSLEKDQFLEAKKPLWINLSAGFTLAVTVFCEPDPNAVEEQVILDVGAAESAERLQLFIDLDGSLVFRIAGSSLTVPNGSQLLAGKWTSLALFAHVVNGTLTMFVVLGAEKWKSESAYSGPDDFGPRQRIGAALSGGRGVKLSFLDLTQWDEFKPLDAVMKLLEVLAERPKQFGVQHGKQ